MTSAEIETKFNDLVYFLQGSCNTLSEEDNDFLTDNDLLERFDDEIFICDECGWWCGDDERSENVDETCDECAGDKYQ